MKFILKKFSELSPAELYDVLRLRNEVFIVEQNCAYQDLDGKDEEAFHMLGYDGTMLAAYARILKPGVCYPEPAIGRVVVSFKHRGKDYGRSLMKNAIEACRSLFGRQAITISAQKYLLNFYNELGFIEEGEEYLEDDIPHIKMKLKEVQSS